MEVRMRFVTWKEIKALGLVPYSRQYIGRLERDGKFPLRRRLRRRVVWVYDEIIAWQETWFRETATGSA
jgi:predicted DNA-binding transcriptional regulator AlpA